MSLFGFTPEEVVSRTNVGAPTGAESPGSRGAAARTGAVGFGVASMLVFGTWAFAGRWMYGALGEIGAYLAWAAMAVGVAGISLRSLVIGPPRRGAFFALFGAAFLLYAAGWMAAWFILRNKPGELLGSLVGTALMSAVFAGVFAAWGQWPRVLLILFITHSAGYFLGSLLFEAFPKPTGMLLWGVAYGLGFGAGIGMALWECQQAIRDRLIPPQQLHPPSSPSDL